MTRSLFLTRRGFLGGSLAAGAQVALAHSARSAPSERALPWQVGAAVADITPPLEVGVLMSTGRRLWQPFEGVRLPLHARAVVIERANRRIALVALDLLGLGDETVGGIRQFKARIAAAADQSVDADDIVLCSTHTHSAPASLGCTDLYRTEPFGVWQRDLARAVGSAVNSAVESMQACRLAVGTGTAPGHAVNRRIKTTKGIRAFRATIPPETIIGPEGPTDESVNVAALLDASGAPVAVLVGATCHPIHEMCFPEVSPDFPGEMCLELERRLPGCVPLFLNGAAGNVNPPVVQGGPDHSRRHGRQLAEVVSAVLDDLEPVPGDELLLRWRTLALPAREGFRKGTELRKGTVPFSLRENRDSPQVACGPFMTRIAALRLGKAAFCFIPGEPFVETALAIRRASPWQFTLVVGYAEQWIGYIPTDRAFDNGGYETKPGRWSQLARGAEPVLRREAIELVRSLENVE